MKDILVILSFLLNILGISYFDIRAAYQQLLRQFFKAYDFPGKNVKETKHEITKTDDVKINLHTKQSKHTTMEELREEKDFTSILKDTKDKIEKEHTDIHLFYVAAELTLFGYFLTSSGYLPTSLNPKYILGMGLLSFGLFISGMISEIRQHANETRVFVRLYQDKYSKGKLIEYLKMYNFELLEVRKDELESESKEIKDSTFKKHDDECSPLAIENEIKQIKNRIRSNRQVTSISITLITIIALVLLALFIWHLHCYYQIACL